MQVGFLPMTLADFSTKALRAELEKRGYTSAPKKAFPWEKPSQFSRRHGFGPTWFSKRLGKVPPPPPFEADKGKTGRVVALRSNPALEAWASR